jgi:5-amino-6-(5-phosphoribosylamino)uracil reductase
VTLVIQPSITRSADLDPSLRFFDADEVTKLVYCANPAVNKARERLADAAVVIDAGEPLSLQRRWPTTPCAECAG